MAKITPLGQAISDALANGSVTDAETDTIITAVNAERSSLIPFDRGSAYELQALDLLIRSPARPFDIAPRAAHRIVSCVLVPVTQQCR